MRAPEKNIKSINSVLDDCFRSLAETGLEKASVRSFYKATNLSSSSLYYRFESKDEIIIEATYNRLYSITNDLFFCAAENIGSFESLAQKFLASADEYKKDIRVIYQVLSSPVYGKELKRRTETLKPFYRRIAALISEELGCQSNELFPFVTLSYRSYANISSGRIVRRPSATSDIFTRAQAACKSRKKTNYNLLFRSAIRSGGR